MTHTMNITARFPGSNNPDSGPPGPSGCKECRLQNRVKKPKVPDDIFIIRPKSDAVIKPPTPTSLTRIPGQSTLGRNQYPESPDSGLPEEPEVLGTSFGEFDMESRDSGLSSRAEQTRHPGSVQITPAYTHAGIRGFKAGRKLRVRSSRSRNPGSKCGQRRSDRYAHVQPFVRRFQGDRARIRLRPYQTIYSIVGSIHFIPNSAGIKLNSMSNRHRPRDPPMSSCIGV